LKQFADSSIGDARIHLRIAYLYELATLVTLDGATATIPFEEV
jgi:hypothetical protein